MRKLAATAVLAAAFAATAPAHAAADGKLQVKLMGTAVLPDGKIDKIKYVHPDIVDYFAANNIVDIQTKANDNVVPTLAIEYFFTPNVSLETICCLTQHDVDGTRDIAGAEMVADAKILPATFTLKYHLDAGAFKPYIGAGPTYFIFIDEKPGATTKVLGADKLKINDKVGVALQAGVDIPVNDKGLGVSLDAKKYFLTTTATWYAGGVEVLQTTHKMDPWVLSAGLAYRF